MAKNNKKTTNTTKYMNYWQKRAETNYISGEKEALKVAKKLKDNYSRAKKEIETKINLFYGRFAADNDMTLEEAKKLLNKDELKSFKENIKDILAMGKKENFTDAQMNDYKKQYAKTKVSRLDELETNIQWELDKLNNTSDTEIGTFLQDTYEDGYYKSIFDVEQFKGFSDSFTALNTEAIYKAVTAKYLGSNYSQRLWQNENNLMTVLEQEIPRGLTLGYNPRKLAKLTSDKLDTNYNNTVRLIRTEYGKILNDATLDGYKASGVDSYQILAALDMRTCGDCGEFDGKIIPINKGETGVNLPPFHPNCRCTTIPYFEPDEFDNLNDSVIRIDKDTDEIYNVPLNISYDEWKNELTAINDKIQYESIKNKIADLKLYYKNNYLDFTNDKKLNDVGKLYFNWPTNDALNKYTQLPHDLENKVKSDSNLLRTLNVLQPDIDKLKMPAPTNFILYSSKNSNINYADENFILSGSLYKEVAKANNINNKNKNVIKFYIQKGAPIISTYNVPNGHFSRQYEIILPTVRKIKQIDKYNYIIYN